MKLNDKLIKDGVKTVKDSQMFQGVVDLGKEKSNEFSSSDIEGLVAGSFFTQIKSLIGKFTPLLTNSLNIIKENSENFYNKVTQGFEKVPEDLKDIEEETEEETNG